MVKGDCFGTPLTIVTRSSREDMQFASPRSDLNMLFVKILFVLLPVVALVSAESDFVIVGAGTAGCALAARLCERMPKQTFTLLERAPPRTGKANFLVRSPRQMWLAWRSPAVVEPLVTLPEPGLRNRALDIYTGRTLGGSSAINAMQWVVPINGTVERWGVAGLTTASSQPFYRRAFRTVGFAAQSGSLRHAYAGEYVRAADKAGFAKDNDPFDNANKRSVFENRLAVDDKGRRVDSCTAYLSPVLHGKCRHNLRLVQGVTVTRVLLKKGNGQKTLRATGVEYVYSNDTKLRNSMVMKASKEVLVSAGPFGSPKLLQLSGIGPRRLLKSLGIKLLAALPVGARTQARAFVAINSQYEGVPLEPSNNSTLLESPASRAQWRRGDGGVLGISSFLANGRDKRDAYITGTGSFFPEAVDQPLISSSCNVNPKSFGFLRIKSSNPFTPATVLLGLLSGEKDYDMSASCLPRLLNIHREFPKCFNMSFVDPPNGELSEKWIRDSAGWAGHFVGGCAVGSVLRADLQVKSVQGLRVIDASALRVMPLSSGPMASTYMLAEYMSDRIARSYR